MNKINILEWWNSLDNEWKKRFIEFPILENRNYFVNQSFDKNEREILNVCNAITKLRLTKLKKVVIPDLSPLNYLSEISFSHIDEIEYENLSTCKKLTSIELWCVPIHDISFVKHNNYLKKLNLFSTLVRSINEIEFCKNLIELRFCKHYLDTEIRITKLEKLESLKNLRVLHIGEDVRHIDTLSFLTHLEEFSYRSLDDVSFLSKNISLKKIFVMGSEKSDFSNLDGFSKLINLEYLNISNSNVEDLNELKNLPSLKTVVVKNTPLHHEHRAVLKKLLMSTKIQKFRKVSNADIKTTD